MTTKNLYLQYQFEHLWKCRQERSLLRDNPLDFFQIYDEIMRSSLDLVSSKNWLKYFSLSIYLGRFDLSAELIELNPTISQKEILDRLIAVFIDGEDEDILFRNYFTIMDIALDLKLDLRIYGPDLYLILIRHNGLKVFIQMHQDGVNRQDFKANLHILILYIIRLNRVHFYHYLENYYDLTPYHGYIVPSIFHIEYSNKTGDLGILIDNGRGADGEPVNWGCYALDIFDRCIDSEENNYGILYLKPYVELLAEKRSNSPHWIHYLAETDQVEYLEEHLDEFTEEQLNKLYQVVKYKGAKRLTQFLQNVIDVDTPLASQPNRKQSMEKVPQKSSIEYYYQSVDITEIIDFLSTRRGFDFYNNFLKQYIILNKNRELIKQLIEFYRADLSFQPDDFQIRIIDDHSDGSLDNVTQNDFLAMLIDVYGMFFCWDYKYFCYFTNKCYLDINFLMRLGFDPKKFQGKCLESYIVKDIGYWRRSYMEVAMEMNIRQTYHSKLENDLKWTHYFCDNYHYTGSQSYRSQIQTLFDADDRIEESKDEEFMKIYAYYLELWKNGQLMDN